MVYVIGDETYTGDGEACIETAISASAAASTRTDVVVALFEETGSLVPEFASAVLTIVVPAATLAPTVTT